MLQWNISVLFKALNFICSVGVVAGGIISSCGTVSQTLSASDTSVNVSCTSVVFSNVVLNGSTLNISISGIVAANPSSPYVTVSISNMTVQRGAILVIDSKGYSADGAGEGPTVSIMIKSLIASDGCLVFLGAFPAGTTILVSGAQMTSSTSSAPMLPNLDPNYGTTYCKMMILINMSLTGNSSIIFADCSLSSSSSISTMSFYTTGALPMTFSNGSMLVFQNCTLSGVGTGTVYPVYMNNQVTFTNSSYLALSSCTLTAAVGGGHAFYINSFVTFTTSSYLALCSCNFTAAGGYAFVMYSLVAFTTSSYLVLSSCNLTAVGGYAFSINSPASFTSSSYLALTSCTLSGFRFAFLVGSMTVDGWSFLVVMNSSFTGNTDNVYPPITLSFSSALVIGNSSWVLWKGNVMNSVPLYSSCIKTDISFSSSTSSPGTISILDNRCTCASSGAMWAATSVAFGGGGKIYQRCNFVNTVATISSQLPTGAISAGACGTCKTSADCFGPLTVSSSTCSINASTSTTTCQCLPGGGASDMCLGPFLSYPRSFCTARARTTTTVSLSSEMPSGVMSSSTTRTAGSRTRSYFGRSRSNSGTISYLSWTTSSSAMVTSSTTGSQSRTASVSLFGSSTSAASQSSSKSDGTPIQSLSAATKEGSITFLESRSAQTATGTSTVISSPSQSPSTFVCELSPKVVLRNTTSLTFSAGGSTPDGPSNTTTAGAGGIVTVVAGGSVPMAAVLGAVGFALRIDFVATAGFSFADPANVTVSLGNAAPAVSRTANISVVVSIANLQIGDLPAFSNTRFVVTVDAVVSPPAGIMCPPGNVTFAFECFFTPLRTNIALKSAVDATYRTSTALSSVLGNPVTAMSNTGMVSILTLEECVFSDIDPLDAAVSPIPLAVGNTSGQFYRGCVVIALAINIGYFTLALLYASAFSQLIRAKTPGDVLRLLKYPSSVMIFVGMFHQGMVSSSVSLLRLANSPLDLVLGSSGLVSATCLTVFMLLAGTRWRRCHIADRSDDETHSSVKAVQLFLNLALWKRHWVDDVGGDGAPSGYKRRYLLILDDMAVAYWAAVELMSGLAQGAILGLRKNDLQTCQIQRLLLTTHCFLMAAASLIIRPCGSFFGNLFLIASKLGSFVISLLILIHTVSGNEAVHQDADLASAGFTFVSSLQTAIQLLLALVLSRKTLLMVFRSLLRRLWAAPQVDDQEALHAMMLGDLIISDHEDEDNSGVELEEIDAVELEMIDAVVTTAEINEGVSQPPLEAKAMKEAGSLRAEAAGYCEVPAKGLQLTTAPLDADDNADPLPLEEVKAGTVSTTM